MNLIEKMNWRYAVKMFDSNKKLDEKTLNEIKETLTLTASSFGLQPWKFLIIKDQETKNKLKEVSWNQPQISDCSDLVVLCGLKNVTEQYIKDYVSFVAKERGIDAESLKAYEDMMIGFLISSDRDLNSWVSNQVYIALGNLLTSCAVLDVDTCALEGISAPGYDNILDLNNTEYKTIVACALGHRSSDDKNKDYKKVRFAQKSVVEVI